MAVNLQKGQKISLEKEAGTKLNSVVMGLGWDAAKKGGFLSGLFGGGSGEIDLDASCFMFDEHNELVDLVFFNHLRSEDGSIQHSGDNRTGDGDGDDESVIVELEKVPANIKSLFVTVTIHDAETRRQHFGQVSNAFVRLVNHETGQEVLRFDLSEDYSTETAMVFGEVYRHNGDWKFRAIGQGYTGGLLALCNQYGVTVG